MTLAEAEALGYVQVEKFLSQDYPGSFPLCLAGRVYILTSSPVMFQVMASPSQHVHKHFLI